MKNFKNEKLLLGLLFPLLLVSCSSKLLYEGKHDNCYKLFEKLLIKGFIKKNTYDKIVSTIDLPQASSIVFDSSDSLTELPKELICIQKLKEVAIVKKPDLNIVQIIDVVSKLPNLEKLYLVENNIKVLPNNIEKLKNIRTLVIAYNPNLVLPKQVKKLKHLSSLTLSKNVNMDFEQLFKFIEGLQISYLDIYGCNMTEVPKNIGKMTYLRELNLGGNPLTALPCEINNLKNCRFILPKEMPKNIIPSCLKNYPFEYQ